MSAEAPDPVEFRLLGPVGVTVSGTPVRLGGEQRTALLTMLLLHPNRVVSAERLTGLLWGPRSARTARSALQVRVSQLRRRLDEAGAGDDRLKFRPPGYLLRVEPGELDQHRFVTLADRGRERLAAGDAAEAARLLHEALDLFQGLPFEDVQASALEENRTRLLRHRLAVLTDRIDADLRLGRHAAVTAELVALVEEHPLDERLRGQLMLAYYRCGRRADALASYRQARQKLVDQLGLEPGEELRHLQREILNASPTPPPAAEQVSAPEQLPADQPFFTGRSDSIDRLDELMPTGTVRPVPVVISAIAGIAGVGKTTLAVHWAHRVRSRFPDGQLYVNLRGFEPTGLAATPGDALRMLLDGLGVPAQRIPYTVDAQANLYRSMLVRKRMLILLDNARDAEQVRPLLPGSPGCVAVVTSRDRLTGLVATEGARLLSLDVFSPVQARELLVGRIGADRAAAEPEAANEIIARCAGLPLALTVVAARAAVDPGLALVTLAAELGDGELNALNTGDTATDIRRVFSSSYRTLGDGARRLARLLGLHPGPDITISAASSLAGAAPDDVRRWFAELVQASFVAEPRPGRFTMHDLLRTYAAEMAQQDESEADQRAAVERDIDHYLHSASAGARAILPHGDRPEPGEPSAGVRPVAFDGSPQAVTWFAEELPVLLAVLRAAVDAGHDRRAAELAWTMARFFDLRSRYGDMADTQKVALAAAHRIGDLRRQARAHRLIGLAASRQALYDEAREHLERALTMTETLGDHTAQGHTRMTLAQLHARTGVFDEALRHAGLAYAAFLAGDQRYGQANALNAIGWYHARLGDHGQALTICAQAVALTMDLGDTRGAASAWDSQGYAHHQRGDYGQARDCFRRAIDLYAETGDAYFEADTLLHLVDTLQTSNHPAAAAASAKRALKLLEALGHVDAERARKKLRELG
ncbi:AfsR/SARP family transcriptional regulator [Mangrovihabitans endophyticus]|nr:BTAD domain-containing putative transcriptional regulator [Mangrovihabitans endophyticus]